MAPNRTHVCVFFDDGGLEPACRCGQRVGAFDDDAPGALVTLLELGIDVDTLAARASTGVAHASEPRERRPLAVSA